MKIENIKTSDLIPYARNAKKHDAAQVSKIAGSIREFGFNNPVLIDKDNGIIAGHGRVMAAQSLALETVPCIRLGHLTDTQRRAYILADNRLAEIGGGWDEEMLKLELADLAALDVDVTEIGFGAEDLAELEMEEVTGNTDPDEVPEPPVEPVSKPGDVWLLGKHRVMCGDSTDRAQVERLMGGRKADMVFTDPPYNIASENSGVAADVSASHAKLMASSWDMNFTFASVQESILSALSEDATVYVCTSHHLAGDIWAWMKQWAKHSSWCVWNKPNPMPSLMKRHWTLNGELICYATRGKHTFKFPEHGHALSVWTISKVNGNSGHPTEKPVAVPEHAILHSSDDHATVLDLFGGSGSTLIACEKANRHARLMELDPKYCDVIVNRWQDFTGKKATHESSGKTFDEMKAAKP